MFPASNLKLMLSGKSYLNNSMVSIREIGECNSALLCVTDNQNCCSPNSGGEFYYSDNNEVNIRAFGEYFYRIKQTLPLKWSLSSGPSQQLSEG